ncbi:MAG: hypothetical protein CMP20_10425 [Rickettsiales bacterium]|nr:hypothetical protein [Rickettsiales bacterium]
MGCCQATIACIMFTFNTFAIASLCLLALMWWSDGRSQWIPWMIGLAFVGMIVNLVVWIVCDMVFYDRNAVATKEPV